MIVTDSKILRTPCLPVLLEEIEELRTKLEDELAASGRAGRPGIGLAAPQIGIFKRMAIIRIPGQEPLDLVNLYPSNITGFDLAVFPDEGCLSFPGESRRVPRYQEILVQGNQVWPFKFVAAGLVAVAIQHEQDHLDGKLLIDYR